MHISLLKHLIIIYNAAVKRFASSIIHHPSSIILLTTIVIGILLGIHFKYDSPPLKTSLIKSWGKMPIYFVENQGQIDPRVGYYVKGGEKTLYFGPEGLTVSIHQAPKGEKTDPFSIKEATAAINTPKTETWNVKLLVAMWRRPTRASPSIVSNPARRWTSAPPTQGGTPRLGSKPRLFPRPAGASGSCTRKNSENFPIMRPVRPS